MPSIVKFIEDRKKFGIPEFQRNWSWTSKGKVEKFFDTVWRGYPLPRFFVWSFLNPDAIPVKLHRFTTDFNNRDADLSNRALEFTEGEYHQMPIAVCDGQQRLTSLLIGFTGIDFGATRANQTRYLYWNALATRGEAHVFEFMSLAEAMVENAKVDNNKVRIHAWVKVCDFYSCAQRASYVNEHGQDVFFLNSEQRWIYFLSDKITGLVNQSKDEQIDYMIANFTRFYRMLNRADYLDFQDLHETIDGDLDEAVEFFVRINGEGKKLDPDDLLFALLARYLDEEIGFNLKDDFLELKRQYEKGGDLELFTKKLPYNFFLRASLYITTNNVLFKVNSFDQATCQNILEAWPSVKVAIKAVFKFLRVVGYGPSLTSFNALIPLVNHFYQKGITEANMYHALSVFEKQEMLKYLIRSQLFNVFGNQADTMLQRLKSNQANLYHLPNYEFSFNDLTRVLPLNKETIFNLSADLTKRERQLKDILGYRYGDSVTLPLLHLLYAGTLPQENIQVDHIHAQALCTSERHILETQHNCDQYNIIAISKNYQKLPNLHLLLGAANLDRSNKPLNKWVDEKLAQHNFPYLFNCPDKASFLRQALIHVPADETPAEFLKINNFINFYDQREADIRTRLIELLS